MMPNIQIRGFFFDLSLALLDPDGCRIKCVFPEKSLEIRNRIEDIMQDMGIGNDSVVEIVPTIVTSCDGNMRLMPYLRVCDTNKKQMKLIVKTLKEAKIGMDVEELLLSGYTEAEKMGA